MERPRIPHLEPPRVPRAALALALFGALTATMLADRGPEPAPSPSPPAPAPASAPPTPSAIPTSAPSATPSASLIDAPGTRRATRIRIRELGIDLAVIAQPWEFPACDVAMFLDVLGQPGEGRAVYIYAHARRGMFLPLLEASRRARGAELIGLVVEVHTDDARLYRYRISEVRPHQTTLDAPLAADHEQLWLQTSEGPKGTIPKLQVVAEPLDVSAADPAEARPSASARACR